MALNKLKKYGQLVLFSHSLFSLPFGLIAMVWASNGLPQVSTVLLIIGALLSARTGANAFNRIADRFIDARNERTANRHLPAGTVQLYEAYAITILSFVLLAVFTYMLNLLCLILLPFAIGLMLFYSYTKRITWLCHYILGVACGCAPVGAWIAVTGKFHIVPLILGAAVCTYVGGFDILYATQDIEFDRKEGLHSIPARFGLKGALFISGISHFLTILLLGSLYFIMNRGIIYMIGVVLSAILLIIEHYNVIPENRNKMIFAAYSINQVISVILFIFTMSDFWWNV